MTKANHLIDASYRLNTQAQKLVLACLSKIDSRKNVSKDVTITALEYAELMGVKNAHRELYKAADSLWDAEITITKNDEKTRLRWIQKDVKKIKGSGTVTITWSDEVLVYIGQLKDRFTTYKLHQIASLKSNHSIRLYELLMRFKSTGERVIYLTDFKSALGISDSYKLFKELNKKVIKPAINELNERSDLTVEYETIKKGRSVAALSFRFTKGE